METNMSKKISKLLMAALVSFMLPLTLQASMHFHSFGGINFDYDFAPNDTQEFENPFFWDASANCSVTTQEDTVPVRIKVTNRSGSVNGRRMHSGDVVVLNVHNYDHFSIKADGYAKVQLINEGHKTIHVKCSV